MISSRIPRLVLPALFSIAATSCESGSETTGTGVPGAPVATAANVPMNGPGSTPFPIPPGAYTLSGLVFDAYTGPVANVGINVWVELPNGAGVSWWYATGHGFYTDAAGRYEVPGLPADTRVKLWVGGGLRKGYLQPCAVTVDMTRDAARDIEVVREETLQSFAPPRPITAREPTLTGTVYEITSTGREPVAGMYFEADGSSGLGNVLANTRTDLNGRYFLCDLPPGIDLMVWKDGGHLLKEIYPVGGPPSTTLDFEIDFEKP